MKSHKLIAASAAAALTFGGIVGGGIVLAQDPGTTPTPSATPSTKEERAAEKQAQFDAYITELAGNLGIDAQTLKDAIKKTNLSFIDKAVADGKLTAEQAQELKDRIEAGNFTTFGLGGFGRGHGGDGDHGGKPGIGFGGLMIGPADHEAIAGFFGMTTEELLTELKGGKSLATVAGENGKSADDLKNFITSEVEKKLGEQVTAGRITQEQADKMKAELSEHLDDVINGTLPQMPKGMKGPRGMAPDEMPAPGSAAPGFSRPSSLPSRTLN